MRLLLVPALVASAAFGALVEEDLVAPQPKKAIDAEAAQNGRLLFGIYCTSCHGDGGRGNGPTARSLDPRPSDLTRLSRDNDGEFPTARVIMRIDGRNRIPGHRDGQMPIWGLSLQESGSDVNQEEQVRKKILRLVEYLKSIQPREQDQP